MSDRKPRHVLDPEWEESLRRGQEVDEGVGSVERELEVVHLFRHLREPEPLSDARFEEILREVGDTAYGASGAGVAGRVSWLRKRWYLWVTPLAAAAAVLMVVVLPPGGGLDGDQLARSEAKSDDREALAQAAPVAEASADEPEEAPRLALAERSAQAQALEKQFEILEAKARAEVDRSVDRGRSAGRSNLFDLAKSAGGPAPQAAPPQAAPETDSAEVRADEAKSRPHADPPRASKPTPTEPRTAEPADADAFEGEER